jgi:hypothetical protein
MLTVRSVIRALLVVCALAPATRAGLVIDTNTFRFAPSGALFEELGVTFLFDPDEEPPGAWPRINSFHIELTFDPADVGMTFSPPSHPLPSPTRGVFALPGATMVDEGSTPQRIRIGGALPAGQSAELRPDSVFAQFQVRVPPNYPNEGFTVIVDPRSTRLTGPEGDIAFEPVGVNYTAADYLPEPAAGLSALAAGAALLSRRRRAPRGSARAA